MKKSKEYDARLTEKQMRDLTKNMTKSERKALRKNRGRRRTTGNGGNL